MMNKTHVFEEENDRKQRLHTHWALYSTLGTLFYDHFVKNLLGYTFFVRMYLENFLKTYFMLLSLLVEVNKSKHKVAFSV